MTTEEQSPDPIEDTGGSSDQNSELTTDEPLNREQRRALLKGKKGQTPGQSSNQSGANARFNGRGAQGGGSISRIPRTGHK